MSPNWVRSTKLLWPVPPLQLVPHHIFRQCHRSILQQSERNLLTKVTMKRCQTNIYLHKLCYSYFQRILISMIGFINTPNLIRKLYNVTVS
jgi:hypothetical protein